MPSRDELSTFIRTTFRSVWSLELLIFLRQHKDRHLSHEEMVAGLRGSDLVVAQSVDTLLAAGLIVIDEEGAARYSPANDQIDRLSQRAESLYAKSPDAVRRMIVAASNASLTAFADAFRLRKD